MYHIIFVYKYRKDIFGIRDSQDSSTELKTPWFSPDPTYKTPLKKNYRVIFLLLDSILPTDF
jgi:hypothetical protein